MTTIIANPGPGTYEPKPSLNEKGNYFLSKFKNSMASTISPSKKDTSPAGKKIAPGPGLYSPKWDFSKDGSYFVSKFRSSMCRTHYHYNRKTIAGEAKTGKDCN